MKRITLQEFKEVADETLTELLGIASIVVKMFALRREGEHEVLHLWCAHRDEVAMCPHCSSLSTKIHQEEPRCIRHLDVWGQKRLCYIFFLAVSSAKIVVGLLVEELPFVDSHRRQSIAFEQHIYQTLSYKHPQGCCSS